MPKFVSNTSTSQERMFYFQIYIKLLLMLISNLQDHQESLSLGINPVDNAVPHNPHDNIVDSLVYDECMRLILLFVCRMLESIL